MKKSPNFMKFGDFYQIEKTLVPSLMQHFLFYQINQVSFSNIMASFVNPLNSSHVVKTKLCLLKLHADHKQIILI